MFNVHSDCTEEKTLIKLQILEMNSNFKMEKNVIMTRLTIKIEKLKIK